MREISSYRIPDKNLRSNKARRTRSTGPLTPSSSYSFPFAPRTDPPYHINNHLTTNVHRHHTAHRRHRDGSTTPGSPHPGPIVLDDPGSLQRSASPDGSLDLRRLRYRSSSDRHTSMPSIRTKRASDAYTEHITGDAANPAVDCTYDVISTPRRNSHPFTAATTAIAPSSPQPWPRRSAHGRRAFRNGGLLDSSVSAPTTPSYATGNSGGGGSSSVGGGADVHSSSSSRGRVASWYPRMHRIASGRELHAADAVSNGDWDRAPPSAMANRVINTTPSMAHSSLLPSPFADNRPRSDPQNQEHPVQQLNDPGGADAADDSSASASSWFWASSAPGTLLPALSDTVDRYIRPLVPASPTSYLSSVGWTSAFASGRRAGQGDDGVPIEHRNSSHPAAHCSGSNPTNNSSNSSSSRYYMHGGVSTHPSRREAMERYACSARMQARATTSSTATSLPCAPPGKVIGGGESAVSSVGLDGDCPEWIRQAVTDDHLLQLGAMLDEPTCVAALETLGLTPACSTHDALYGVAEDIAHLGVAGRVDGDNTERGNTSSYNSATGPMATSASPPPPRFPPCTWDAVVKESKPGLSLKVWRMPLRQGLYIYRSSVFMEGMDPREVRPFHLDDQARSLWDDSALSVERLPPPQAVDPGNFVDDDCSSAGRVHHDNEQQQQQHVSRHAESCIHQYISRFPRPMAPREYTYARRVWNRPSDGGCYVIARHADGLNNEGTHQWY